MVDFLKCVECEAFFDHISLGTTGLYENWILAKGFGMVRNGCFRHRGTAFFLSLVGCLCIAVNAYAGPLSITTLAFNNGNGQDVSGRWQNSELLTITTPSPFGDINGTVEYAVFAPGVFQTFADAEFGSGTYTIPESATNYTYAFQFVPTVGTVESLNAGYDTGVPSGIPTAKPGWLAGSGDRSPVLLASFLNTNSAVWGYGPAAGTSTDVSDIVYYLHPNPPKPDQVTLRGSFGSGQADSGPIDFASPIPEPSSVLLAFVGIASAAIFRKRRRPGQIRTTH